MDLLLTDIAMPGMNGFAVADHAKSQRPDLRVIYISGYAAAAMQSVVAKHGKLIPKPFSPARILSEITAALAA